MKPAKTEKGQIRLILPKDWIPDLDSIAASKFISRLDLIRRYLRECADRDLTSLKSQLEMVEDLKNVSQKILSRAKSIESSCNKKKW